MEKLHYIIPDTCVLSNVSCVSLICATIIGGKDPEGDIIPGKGDTPDLHHGLKTASRLFT